MRQALNNVNIEGILSEIDLNEIHYNNKAGVPTDAISGSIKIKVPQVIAGKEVISIIPVHFFANKLTKDGSPNKMYESVKNIKDTYVSIAASDENTADRIRVTKGSIEMNEYFDDSGKLISFPRIKGTFVRKVKPEEYNPMTSFEVEAVIGNKFAELNAQGMETGRMILETILPQYRSVDKVPFYSGGDKVVAAIKNPTWAEGKTITFGGKLNFTSTTEEIQKDMGFGEPVIEKRTIRVSELVITRGAPEPLVGEMAFDVNEIRTELANRQARLEELKNKPKSKATTTTTSNLLDPGF